MFMKYQNTFAFFWIRILHGTKLWIRFNLKLKTQYTMTNLKANIVNAELQLIDV